MSCPRRYVVIKIDSHSLVDVQGHLELPYLHEVATHCVLLWSEGFSSFLVIRGRYRRQVARRTADNIHEVHRCMALAAIGQPMPLSLSLTEEDDGEEEDVMGGTYVVIIAHAQREDGVVSRAALYRGHLGREDGDGEEEDAMSPEERSLCTTSHETSLTVS